MNTAKNFTTIHLRLNWIDGLEALILLIACLIKVCVPIKTEDLNLSVFNMIAGINESKALTKHISCKCKKSHVMYVKKILFGILLHIIVKMENI